MSDESTGVEIAISSNFFAITKNSNYRLLQYKVDMVPDIDKGRKSMLFEHRDCLPPNFILDGKCLFTYRRLTQDDAPMVFHSNMHDGQVVVITIRLVEEVQASDYNQHSKMLKLLLKRCLKMGQQQKVGRNEYYYYDPINKLDLSQFNLELWPGYKTSIRQHKNSILLCCGVSYKIQRTDTVLEQMQEIYKRDSANFKSACEKVLLGGTIMTRYDNKTFKVNNIDWDKHPTDSFESSNGDSLTFIQYYQEQYNLTLRDLQQPMLVIRPQGPRDLDPILLVPELCLMTNLSEEQRAKLMKARLWQDPAMIVSTLKGFSKRMKNSNEIQGELNSWNLEFKEDLVQFSARVLSPELILGSLGNINYSHDNADWSGAFGFGDWEQWSGQCEWTMWAVVYATKDAEVTQQFVNNILKIGPSLGMDIAKPKTIELTDNRLDTYIQTLDSVIDTKPDIVMVVVPDHGEQHYTAVTRFCLGKSVPSQVLSANVMLGKPRGYMSVATKVALQMNCKLGGEPWAVDIPFENMMVIGYDTCQDTLLRDRSVGAVVASINNTFTKFISMANYQSNQSEITDCLCTSISKALRKYNTVNGCLPERVIVYRDVVEDGQIPYIVEHELVAINNCFKEIKFTYIIVNKRTDMMLFWMNGKPTNPHSGTVVDNVVTVPGRYEFFLVSQSVREGTVNPTSYTVVKDTSGLRPEQLQLLTYKLTHLCYNWPGTIRVPAVCQYASELAFLVAKSLHEIPPDGLEDSLYFL
eukprot:GFUD01025735.1.p1 GENE.GFUD01025735.1~~GFUD01025735.1.p1  ORF type:complete len:750 (+),score=193.64 GFUD01025735.1:69-2318(+)